MPNKIFIPSEFKLNKERIKVEFDNDYCNKESLYGEADFSERVITLSNIDKGRKMKKEEIDKTFYHELMHFLFDAIGKERMKYDEELVEALAIALYEFERTKK